MSNQAFKNRVQAGSTVLMGVTCIYLVYYLYSSFSRAYRFCFGEPERWQNHWRVEDGAIIADWTRVQYFLIWAIVIVISAIATLVAIRLLNRCRKGLIFDSRTAQLLRVFGGILVLAMIADQIFGAVELNLLTKHNLVNVEPIRWAYDPVDYKTIVLALVLFLFGSVMREAIEIEKTNKEFV